MINPSTGEKFETIKFDEVIWDTRAGTLKKIARKLLQEGYKVMIYTSKYSNKEGAVGLKYTLDGVYFSYIQQSRLEWWKVTMSTTHQGHKKFGTGTRKFEGYLYETEEDIQKAIKEAARTLEATVRECQKRKLKPTDSLTFKILNYMEVIE